MSIVEQNISLRVPGVRWRRRAYVSERVRESVVVSLLSIPFMGEYSPSTESLDRERQLAVDSFIVFFFFLLQGKHTNWSHRTKYT